MGLLFKIGITAVVVGLIVGMFAHAHVQQGWHDGWETTREFMGVAIVLGFLCVIVSALWFLWASF